MGCKDLPGNCWLGDELPFWTASVMGSEGFISFNSVQLYSVFTNRQHRPSLADKRMESRRGKQTLLTAHIQSLIDKSMAENYVSPSGDK